MYFTRFCRRTYLRERFSLSPPNDKQAALGLHRSMHRPSGRAPCRKGHPGELFALKTGSQDKACGPHNIDRIIQARPLAENFKANHLMTKLTCFKAYDIRGQLGAELNEDIAYRIGRAYAQFLDA